MQEAQSVTEVHEQTETGEQVAAHRAVLHTLVETLPICLVSPTMHLLAMAVRYAQPAAPAPLDEDAPPAALSQVTGAA